MDISRIDPEQTFDHPRSADGARDAGLARLSAAHTVRLPFQPRMEAAFGQSLEFVRVQTGAAHVMPSRRARAAAYENIIAFADNRPSPWIVAHELTHVIQQKKTNRAETTRDSVYAPRSNPTEVEADRVADRVMAGKSAGPISATSEHSIHLFSPDNHQSLTVAGLSDSFSPEEIGAVYAANWERDFSQGHPAVTNVAIAWAALKNYIVKHPEEMGTGYSVAFFFLAATFQDRVEKLLSQSTLGLARGSSLGGTKEYEHMDAPFKGRLKSGDWRRSYADHLVEPGSQREAADRWAGKGNGVAGYILDSRAYIKDQMLAAVDFYRLIHQTEAVGTHIDAWDGAKKPQFYVERDVSKRGDKVATWFRGDFNDALVDSRQAIINQTAAQVRRKNNEAATAESKQPSDSWSTVAQHLGRAMHAFEDFWSHSNWIELARRIYKFDETIITNKNLKTGTFGLSDKKHALGHKIAALANVLKRDIALLNKVYGLKEPSTRLESEKARKSISGDNDRAFVPLTFGGFYGVARTVGSVKELTERDGNKQSYNISDFLTNVNWRTALADMGRNLIIEGDKGADPDSHGKIAKDQEEGGKLHHGAMLLAEEANRRTFGPLRGIMDELDTGKAQRAIQEQLQLVDRMIQAPSYDHPLWPLVKVALRADREEPHGDH